MVVVVVVVVVMMAVVVIVIIAVVVVVVVAAAALLKLDICFDEKRHKNTEMLNSPFDVYRPNLINKWFVNYIESTHIFQTNSVA
jgi:hypothetical protein